MHCEICHQQPDIHGVTLWRVNPTGEVGIWRCDAHLETPIGDEVLEDIVDIIVTGAPLRLRHP